MIDTDKYEGHHKAWVNEYGDVVKLVYPNEESPSLDADQLLISDAPLLLEEVKRLREAFITAVRHIDVESRNEMFNDMDADLQSIWLFRSE